MANTSFHLVFSSFFHHPKIISRSQKILELGYKHAMTGHLDAPDHKCKKAGFVGWLVGWLVGSVLGFFVVVV